MNSIHLVNAFNSFDGFLGAIMPTNPTNQEEFSAMVNPTDGGSCWSGEAPTWEQVLAKVAEFEAVAAQKVTDKANATSKLEALGLSSSEIDALTK
tara:strand:+ start:202 stop:486 length:285 start_codon:yes stop_codon:yes gene_type:complete